MQLGDPQGTNAFIQRCPVHVDSGSQRKNKTTDAFIDTIVLLSAFNSGWQSGRARLIIKRQKQRVVVLLLVKSN